MYGQHGKEGYANAATWLLMVKGDGTRGVRHGGCTGCQLGS